ncbi:MAG TPA: TetR/AcrR family transcriptional regulator [Acidimicrobiales bacterium]|nr:TetR/AcrR family transcriptional regulator [Acidimicrobiales bacterium]
MGDLDTAASGPATDESPGPTRDFLAFRDERARDAIVDAMLGLYHRGVADPTALEIADQAGGSLRSVYYHFSDLESLAIEAVGRQRAQIEPLLIPPIATGTLDHRITETVERRCELYEVVTPVRRAALLLRHRSPTIDENLAFLARVLREQLATTFAPELDAADERSGRGALLDALDVATSWEAWERLRTSQALTRDRARAVVQLALRSLLR